MRPPLLAVAALLLAATSVRAEEVAFPGADQTTIRARLFRPVGSGPFPVIVSLHGCGGLTTSSGDLPSRETDWRDRWVSQGYLVIFPDSYASRGLGSQCTVQDRSVRPAIERTADVAATRAYLQSRPDVKADKISLIGYSNGASTVLWALRADQRPTDGRPDFTQAIAFYPGCKDPLEAGVVPRRPLLILIGAADNWTPAAPCTDFVARAHSAGASADIVAYEGAYHDFDAPGRPIRERTGLAFTADGSGHAFTGTNEAARADAIARVTAALAR